MSHSRQGTPSVTATCLVLLSSGNTSFSHTSLHLILTKFAHSDRYLSHYSHTKDGGVWGHYEVTGVKKVIFTKNASSPSDYVASTRDFCICSSLTPSTKVMALKNCQGFIWGHWGQKFIFPKKALSPSDYVALTRDLCICSSLTPSIKVMGIKIDLGSFGVTGVKMSSFTENVTPPSCFIGFLRHLIRMTSE